MKSRPALRRWGDSIADLAEIYCLKIAFRTLNSVIDLSHAYQNWGLPHKPGFLGPGLRRLIAETT